MTVRHSKGSYEVRWSSASGALDGLPEGCVVITDGNVAKAWGSLLSGRDALTVEPGEGSKSVEVYRSLVAQMAASLVPRSSVVVAFGGGVVGDLAGFVAATYHRGVRLIQIPTSLLAQVDSSVGGKVGVNLAEGKNLVGAFYPPEEVRCSTEFLTTLPPAEFLNGTSEVWKHAFITDSPLLSLLNEQPLTIECAHLEDVIRACIQVKRGFVEADEFERTGSRAALNFGHTVGHAIEREGGFERFSHGAAVAIGMVSESRLGELLGVTEAGTAAEIERLLRRQGLPTDLPSDIELGPLVATMARDKKSGQGGIGFALLKRIGACKIVKGVGDEAVVAALTER